MVEAVVHLLSEASTSWARTIRLVVLVLAFAVAFWAWKA